ncbi:MAG: hypothetical protein ACXWDM_07195 [Nocardioides sp.]
MEISHELQTFLDSVEPAKRKRDAETLLVLFHQITGEPAVQAHRGLRRSRREPLGAPGAARLLGEPELASTDAGPSAT